MKITFEDLAHNPLMLAGKAALPDGAPIAIRPITAQDAVILGRYFLSLSDQTKAMYGPHPFDQATADKFCAEINYAETIRFIGLIPEGAEERVIAYFILAIGVPENELNRYQAAAIALNPQTDCLVAPSVADEFQNQGAGSIMMRHVFESAQSLGRKHVVLMGGVYQINERAVHFYQKMGFKAVGTFASPWAPEKISYDMYKRLDL